jgi:hypothetical protein
MGFRTEIDRGTWLFDSPQKYRKVGGGKKRQKYVTRKSLSQLHLSLNYYSVAE